MRLRISVKMILTTTVLIIITVLGSGLLNVNAIRKTFDSTVEDKNALFRDGRSRLGESGTPLFAHGVQQLLYDEGRDSDILALVRTAVTQDTKPDDAGLAFAYVVDKHEGLVAHCAETVDESHKLDCAQGAHQSIDKGYPLLVDTWTRVKKAWGGKPDGLVRLDYPTEDPTYSVFAYPVIDKALPEPLLGYVVLGYDLSPIKAFEDKSAGEKAAASRKAALYTALVGVLFALIGTVLAILQGLSISRPIRQLAWKADRIARGDLSARADVGSGDEIGVLGQNFNFMAEQIEILLSQTAEQARLEQELAVAKAIQETLVPGPDLVERGPLSVAGYYQPAAQTGGDWWTWARLDDTKTLVTIGDVTGHGVPSAMITAAAKAASDVARYVHGGAVTVTELLEVMNYAIIESAQRKLVMTCFAAIVDTRANTITFANAGHNFPYLMRRGELTTLTVRGNRLGDEQASTYEPKTIALESGDVLVWYTDGLVECENKDGVSYGERRFRTALKKAAMQGPVEMRDAIVEDAKEFYGQAPRKDDITLVVGRLA